MIKKSDFVEIKYVGRIKEGNTIFDLNDEEVAKKEGLENPESFKRKVIVCVGERDLVEGLDDALVGKEVGKAFDIEISAEKGFGKRDSKLFSLVPLSEFKKQNINPYPGLQLTIDNQQGTVKTVNSGRIMMDFNHPLAGKDLVYHVTPIKVVTDPKEKVEGFLSLHLNQKAQEIKIDGNKLTLKMKIPDQFKDIVKEKMLSCIKDFKEIKFES